MRCEAKLATVALSDAHVHFFSRGYRCRYGAGWARRDEVAAYDALRRVHGIDLALVVGYERERRYRGNNHDIASWGKRHSWMACLASVDPRRGPTLATLHAFWEQGFIGLSIYCASLGDAHGVAGWSKRVIGALNERRAVLSFNVVPEATGALAAGLRCLDGCNCLISHLGLPGQFPGTPTRDAIRRRLRALFALASYGHIGVKLSGLYAVSSPPHAYPHGAARPMIQELASRFGGDRLYWGSDYPPCLDHVSFVQTIDCLVENGLPVGMIHAVYGENLRRIVSLARQTHQ
jgi:predicted TIM-barrel fold metal-dependent hydrolase